MCFLSFVDVKSTGFCAPQIKACVRKTSFPWVAFMEPFVAANTNGLSGLTPACDLNSGLIVGQVQLSASQSLAKERTDFFSQESPLDKTDLAGASPKVIRYN